jgi:glycogen(starch) synthase
MEVEALAPKDPAMKQAIESLTSQGVKVLYGRWLIEGAPTVLLFDVGSMYHRLTEWKGDLWNRAQIPTHVDDFEMNEAIIFGYLVAWFLGEVRSVYVRA